MVQSYEDMQGTCIDCANHPDTNHEKVQVAASDSPPKPRYIANEPEPGPIERLGVNTYKREVGRDPVTKKFGPYPYGDKK